MRRKNFPGRKAARQESAKKRQEEWSKLTPKQQLHALNLRLGEKKGARKQRDRLWRELQSS